MIRFLFLLILQISITGSVIAQIDSLKQADSLPKLLDSLLKKKIIHKQVDSETGKISIHLVNDSLTHVKTDSLKSPILNQELDTTWMLTAKKYKPESFTWLAFDTNNFFAFKSPAISIISDKVEFKGKDALFYTLIAILLFFAFIRLSFPKYFGDLFRVAFRTTLKQRQIGEQLVQTPIPSLLLNIFFLVSIALYINFIIQHYHLSYENNFWLFYFYCFIALGFIYIIKFLSLKFSGWLFNISSTTDAYIFIVFMINKITGILLLPFLILLAFTDDDIYRIALTLSYIGVFGLLAYRFILSYGLVQNQIRLHPFHFFLYLCAFEIVPLLLIYKALLLWFSK